MKICVLTHTFPRDKKDTAAAFMREFCSGLADKGNKVVVLTPFDVRFKKSKDAVQVFTYKYIWPVKFSLLGYSRTMEADIKLKRSAFMLVPMMVVFGSIALYKLVKKERIEIISVHWILPNGLIAFIVSKLTGIPYTVTLPGTDAYLAGRFKLLGFISKLIANHASGIFSNSPWHLDKIIKLGVVPKISDVITYPVNTNKFRPLKNKMEYLRQKLNLKKTDFVVLAVGRLVYKKGFEYLIKAMGKITKKIPNVKLIIGGEGDLYTKLKSLIKQKNLDNKIQLLGTLSRDEIVYYYNLADIMVTPSVVDAEGNIDGRPVVILESMACGKAQIVTNLPGISDSLINNQNALLVPQKNPSALADAVIQLLLSPVLRKKMGEKNRQLAIRHLSVKEVGQKYRHYFNDIINSK